MSQDLSFSESTPEQGTLLFSLSDGRPLSVADISTLREALSIAEEHLKKKRQNVARLSASQRGWNIALHDGESKITTLVSPE